MQSHKLSLYFVSVTLLALLLAGATTAFAQTPQNALTEEDKTRVLNLVANMSNRNEATIERLSQISDRMGERFNLLSSEGYDTAEGWIMINAARESITTARQKTFDVDTMIATTLDSENPQAQWPELKENLVATKTDIETAKELLLNAMDVVQTVVDAGPAAQTQVTTETAPQAQ